MYTNFEPIKKKNKFFKNKTDIQDHKSDAYQRTFGFICLNCKFMVRSDIAFSGVLNRNHCPFCLWSRHVDLWQAGDRLSACKMPMRPIGLTFKKLKNKYGSALGELMLIHQCSDCHAISINRIAADDDIQKILEIMEGPQILQEDLLDSLKNSGIEPVTCPNFKHVREQLLGKIINIHA
ncbi:MAG: RNHCP domain-containing protein [Anaerolineaceae bacterium]